MAFYVDEEEAWKCLKHPSKRRRSGICPTCLRDRLATLCPDCANVRPCECCPASTASASSSSSSSSSSFSFSFFSASASRREGSSSAGVGAVGRVSNLIDGEPSFRRSRSVANPFLRSRFAGVGDRDPGGDGHPSPSNRRRSSFWSIFKRHKSRKSEDGESNRNELEVEVEVEPENNYVERMMMRSRSVSVPVRSAPRFSDVRASPAKGRGWHFPSPINVFRHSKTNRVVQERSPLYRG